MKSIKIQTTSFNKDAIKAMGFEGFKKRYSKVIRGDMKSHFEAITGEKVKQKRAPKEND